MISWIFHSFSILTLIIVLSPLYSKDRPVYKIIIDPGHGGTNQKPFSEFGDKWDILSGRFLEPYRAGAEYNDRTEREIVLKLGKELKKILDLTKTKKGFQEFRNIVSLYSSSQVLPIEFNTLLTREDDSTIHNWNEGDDMNYRYRLYDFVDRANNRKILGRLSIINQEMPYLVVSLHLNPSNKDHPGGMASVIVPPYRVFQNIRLISNGKMNESIFWNSPYRDWLKFVEDWNHLENAMADTWIYFHGYWSDKTGKVTNIEKFSGYRHNMVTWNYADPPGWEEEAIRGVRGQYAKNHGDYIARGKFWNRERGQGERWRRDKGIEGFGGDNLYAGNELLRFVHYGLSQRLRIKKIPPELGPIHPPYISAYSLPTYTNAIVAFLEIGFIDNERDMKYINGETRIVAESLAAGIYSLFMGTNPIPKKELPYIPVGKKLGFEKYESINGKNYFRLTRITRSE